MRPNKTREETRTRGGRMGRRGQSSRGACGRGDVSKKKREEGNKKMVCGREGWKEKHEKKYGEQLELETIIFFQAVNPNQVSTCRWPAWIHVLSACLLISGPAIRSFCVPARRRASVFILECVTHTSCALPVRQSSVEQQDLRSF